MRKEDLAEKTFEAAMNNFKGSISLFRGKRSNRFRLQSYTKNKEPRAGVNRNLTSDEYENPRSERKKQFMSLLLL